jgi:RNA-directed DNA polymerase
VDIQSFFPNTSYKLILKVCGQLFDGQMSAPAKYALADICSFSGGLPMGAPTSPGLANIVLKSADQSISKACTKYGINYSRYADDLTFSSDGHPVKIIPFVEKVLGELGYDLDQKKTNIFRRGRRQVVTGLVVNEKANLPRRIRKRLRAAVHRRSVNKEIHWQGKPMSEDCLIGHLNWLHSVQPDEAKRYKKILTES